MAINLNKDYDDETLLQVFYKIMRDNLDAIVAELGVVLKVADSKLSAVPIASETTVGGIKLHTRNGQNNSGLSIGDDGSCAVVTRSGGGLSRDGAGQLQINTGGVTSGMLADGAVTAEKLGSDISIATPDQIQAPYHIGGNHLITAENAQYLSGEDFINDFCKIMWPKYNIAGVEEFCDWIDEQVAKLNALQK